MTQFHIYHCTNPETRFQEIEKQDRAYAGFVIAYSLEDAFRKSQNYISESEDVWNVANPCRSTSVGDVIHGESGLFMVCDLGFKEVVALDTTLSNLEPLNQTINK